MRTISTKKIVVIAMTAALYALLTITMPETLSFLPGGPRIAEIMVPLIYFNPIFGYGLVLGCFIANMFSPMMGADMIFGTFGTVFTFAFIQICKKLPLNNEIIKYYISSIGATISMIFIGMELFLFLKLPFVITTIGCMTGEFTMVTIIGFTLYLVIFKDKKLRFKLENIDK